jgi:hypothetical protein
VLFQVYDRIVVFFPLVAADPKPPNAVLEVSAAIGSVPFELKATASQSSDPDGQALEYRWFVNEAASGEGRNLATVLQAPGTYLVEVEVRDQDGLTARASQFVIATAPAAGSPPKPALVTKGNEAPVTVAAVAPSAGSASVLVNGDFDRHYSEGWKAEIASTRGRITQVGGTVDVRYSGPGGAASRTALVQQVKLPPWRDLTFEADLLITDMDSVGYPSLRLTLLDDDLQPVAHFVATPDRHQIDDANSFWIQMPLGTQHHVKTSIRQIANNRLPPQALEKAVHAQVEARIELPEGFSCHGCQMTLDDAHLTVK